MCRSDDNPGSSRLRPPSQFPHDEHEKEQSRFRRLLVFREVALDALLLFTTEGRVRQDDVHTVFVANVTRRCDEAVAWINLRRFDFVKQQVLLPQQKRWGLRFAAEDVVFEHPPPML